ncbi:T9SS type A sorting domain-containing protein, partial [Myroides marinus]
TATVTPLGGTGTYTYSWYPSGGNAATATGLAAGIYTVTVMDANACTMTYTFAITQPTALTATTSQTNVSCNGGTNGTATVIPSGGAGGYTYSWAPSGGTAATATGLAAGTYTVTITDANACTTTVTATITEPNVVQAPKVTSNSVSFKYGDSATALVATNDANHTLKWYEGDNKTLLTKAPIPITNKIGKQTYWVSQVNSTECESELVKIEVTITPATLTVTADAQSKVYGSVDSALTYQVTGIVNAEKESDVLSGNLSRDKGENVGSYLIDQGTLIANGNYTMTFAASNLTITPASLTVTADAQSKVYGSVDSALTYQVIGLVDAEKESDVLSGNLSRDKGENVGLYIINQGSLKASSNYTLDFKPNNLEITPAALTVKVDTQSKVYGSADPALTYQVTGLVDAEKESAVLSGNLSRDKGENVGSYLINQGTLIANGNYTMTFAGSNLTITPATLTVTADVQSKVYGSADPALTYKVTGLVNAEKESAVLSGNLSRDKGENVGSYLINQVTLIANGNYTMTFTGSNLTITPAPLTVTADAKTKVYGSVDPALTYKVTGLMDAEKESDVLSGSLTRIAGESVGNYEILKGSLNVNSNYSLTFNKAELTITKASITGVKLEDASYVYDGQEKELVVNGNLPKDATISYVSNKQTETGVYEVTALVTAPNYIDLPLKAKLTISKSTITGVKLEDASYVYDGHEKELLISGNLPKDATVSYVANKQTEAGVYDVTALVSAPNYIDLPLKAKLTISKAKQEITFNKLTPIVFDKNIQLQLTASSNSGLPVSYTYSYEGSKAAAIVSPSGTVTVVSQGRIVITVHQVGNNNYAPAKSISQALVIINDEALITDWKINGQRQGALSSTGVFRQECNEITDQMDVELETSVGAEVSTGSKFSISTPKAGIYRQEVVVTSQSGSTTKKYEIVIERPFGFDDIVIQKFDNTLLVNNNPQTNGGYRFIGYRWYKNDQLIGTEQVYSVGNKKEDLLDINALYRVELVTDKGEVLHSCASTIRYTHTKNIQLYPNPVVKNGVLEVAIDYPSTALDQMSASVYSLTGQFLFTVPLQGAVSKVNLPSNMVEGVYIMLIKIEGKTKTFRFMVKP